MFHIFCQKYNLRGVHSGHSYAAVFHHKLENWQEVDHLWAVYLKVSKSWAMEQDCNGQKFGFYGASTLNCTLEYGSFLSAHCIEMAIDTKFLMRIEYNLKDPLVIIYSMTFKSREIIHLVCVGHERNKTRSLLRDYHPCKKKKKKKKL